jgi:nicotinamidase-related amidase
MISTMKGFQESHARLTVDPKRTAVVAMHWQVDVIRPKGAFGDIFSEAVGKSGVIPRTAAVLNGAREAGCLIIFSSIGYRPGYSGAIQNNSLFRRAVDTKGFIVGTPGVDVIDELRPGPDDLVIDHARSSAFYGSDLMTVLIGRGIDTIALSGIATNVAVDHTARDAMQFGFNTLFLEDCCFSSDPEHHKAALVTMRVLCSAVITGTEFTKSLRSAT